MISRFYTNKAKRATKTPPKDDPQKYRVYAMERSWIGTSLYTTVPLKELQAISDHASRRYRVRPPKIKAYSKPKERVFGAAYEDGEIRLNRGFHGQNLPVLLHELAHHISDRVHPESESHGPLFMSVYTHLLHMYKVMPLDCTHLLAQQFDVAIGTY